MATTVFDGIKFFQEILKKTMAGTFLWKIPFVVSEKKMFKEKVNAGTNGRTTDNRPWHKLAGLQPVELNIVLDWEGIAGFGDNSNVQHFLLFSTVFSPNFSIMVVSQLPFWCTKDEENIVRKGEIASNKQFLLSSLCFLPYMALIFRFQYTLKCCL